MTKPDPHADVIDPDTKAVLDNCLARIEDSYRKWSKEFHAIAARHGQPEPGEDAVDYYWELGKTVDGAFRAMLLRRID